MRHSYECAQKALTFDDSNSDALALLSPLNWFQGRYDQAVTDAKRAVAINPNSASAYQALADALVNSAEPDEALDAAKKAMRLDPARQDFYAYSAGLAYYLMGRNDDAVNVLKRHLAAYPNNLAARLTIAVSYVELGREQDARTEANEITRISPHYSVASWPGIKDKARSEKFRNDLRRAGLK